LTANFALAEFMPYHVKTMTPRAFLPEARSAKACGASSMV
jgi:hypothetical protein